MPKEPEKRQSNLSDADLCDDCDKRLVALRRDQVTLEKKGVSTDRLNDFETLIKKLRAKPADDLDEQIKALENEKRDTAQEDLRDTIRAVRGPVVDAYGDESRQYKALGTGELADLIEGDLLQAATTCVAGATVLLDDEKVVREGLTQDLIDTIEPAAAAVSAVLRQRDTLVMRRSLNAQERVRLHNELNAECATLCGKGYREFWKTDPKRADDYVRDPAPGSSDDATAETGTPTPPTP